MAHIIASQPRHLLALLDELDRYKRWHAEVRQECADLRATLALAGVARAAVDVVAAYTRLPPEKLAEIHEGETHA